MPVEVQARPSEHRFWHNLWQVLKTIQARLRFIAILVAIGLLIGYWDTLSNYYEKWTRPSAGADTAGSDFEYFCPMHPFIVRDNRKDPCPICHMELAKRKKSLDTAEPLPPGTVSRVQLTPYRVVLAGVQMSEVTYHPLTKEIVTFGSVEFNESKLTHIAARQKGRIVKMHVNFTNQMVEKGEELALLDVRYSPELMVSLEDLLRARTSGNKDAEAMALKRLRIWDVGDRQIDEFLKTGKVKTQMTIYSPIKGYVIKKYQKEGSYVDEGSPLYDVADLETVWIEAQVYEADQELLQAGLKASATMLGLPNQVFDGTLDFVYPHLDESSRTLLVRFHVPNPGHKLRPGMYATVKVEIPPSRISTLAQALQEEPPSNGRYAMLQKGLVLAVPDSAVIDTGAMKIVYRESRPDVFDGVAVQLGSRMAEPGNPTVFYPVIRGLQAGDKIVTNGSFLIDAETRLNPAAGSIYFGGTGGKTGPSTVSVRPSTPEDADKIIAKPASVLPPPSAKQEDAGVVANLAKLSRDDRLLADAQKYCPVTAERLGEMDMPVKVIIKEQPVFVCCKGCVEDAQRDANRTLNKVKELKSKTKAEKQNPH